MNARQFSSFLLLSCCLLLMLPATALPQAKKKPAPAQQPKPAPETRVSIQIEAGYGFPLSKAGIKQFWEGGPSASALVLIRAQKALSVGIGAEGTLLKFRPSDFESTFPGVPVQERSIGYIGLAVAVRYTPFEKYRFAPYFGATVGAGKYTTASYSAVINGVRTTYYNIPGTARLSMGAIGGAEYKLSPQVWFAGEVRVTYLFHDPNAGWGLMALLGPRFSL